MKLHNQKGAAISWEALGVTYEWAPYGACDVPDKLVPLLRSEGFPVDVTPVPPKEKAARAAAEQTEEAKDAEIARLAKALSSAEALVVEARAATEAAESRATAADNEAKLNAATVAELQDRVATLQRDADEFQQLLLDASKEKTQLREQLNLATAAKPPQPQPPPAKPKT
jgi:hypothetical protein